MSDFSPAQPALIERSPHEIAEPYWLDLNESEIARSEVLEAFAKHLQLLGFCLDPDDVASVYHHGLDTDLEIYENDSEDKDEIEIGCHTGMDITRTMDGCNRNHDLPSDHLHMCLPARCFFVGTVFSANQRPL